MENSKSTTVPKNTKTIIPSQYPKSFKDFWIHIKKQHQEITGQVKKLTVNELEKQFKREVYPILSIQSKSL